MKVKQFCALLILLTGCKYHSVPDDVMIRVVKARTEVAGCQKKGEVRAESLDERQAREEVQFQTWKLGGDILLMLSERKTLLGKAVQYELVGEAWRCAPESADKAE